PAGPVQEIPGAGRAAKRDQPAGLVAGRPAPGRGDRTGRGGAVRAGMRGRGPGEPRQGRIGQMKEQLEWSLSPRGGGGESRTRGGHMPFQRDRKDAALIGPAYGEYLVTYTSDSGRVRAHLFRNWGRVQAYVSFPRDVPWGEVTEPWYSQLWQ